MVMPAYYLFNPTHISMSHEGRSVVVVVLLSEHKVIFFATGMLQSIMTMAWEHPIHCLWGWGVVVLTKNKAQPHAFISPTTASLQELLMCVLLQALL